MTGDDGRHYAEKLWASAGRVMVVVTCSGCTATVAEVRDAPDGPVLRLEHPTEEAGDLLRMNKRLRDLGGSYAVRIRVTDDHGGKRFLRPGERVPYPPKARRVRRVERDDWTVQVVHCNRHGWSYIGRDDLLAAVKGFRATGRVVGVRATIAHIAQAAK